jgi:hypothetical protein
LAIDEARTGLPVFPGRHPDVAAEEVVHPLPGTVLLPAPKIMGDDLPRGEVVGQQAPGTATTQDIQDTIQDFPFRILLGSAPRLRGGHLGGDQRPFLVREVGRVRFSGFHSGNGTPPYWAIASFLNTL